MNFINARELEDKVKKVSVKESVEDVSDWEERDFEEKKEENDLEGEEESGGFSIEDTMLTQSESIEDWENRNLEDVIGEESKDFSENDDFSDEGFSYEAMSGGSSGDLYGGGEVSDNLYGVGSSCGDMYNICGGSCSGNLYNSGSNSSNSMYAVVDPGKKKTQCSVYSVGVPKKKNKRRKYSQSGLENGLRGRKKR